ncbi:hypothetical protein F441_17995 [Phytophthora nicotianae CJ01A1]|uniref:PX domain-containing protein n=1 Tax=Phytophthora nicotianae CJ01A1 TaxID=1317063 RepID=W2W4C7_PHYNI|nr:hypothetical protein F441_17995 [Phytophthora nicotianae CJ01A1]
MAHFRIGPVRLIIPAMQTQEQAKGLTRSSSRSIFPVETRTSPNASTSQRRQLTLHEIESLVVSGATSRREGTKLLTYYTLDVYTGILTPSSKDIDAARTQLNDSEDTRPPAYRVEKTLVDFDNLRQALFNASHLAHTSVSCEFCKEMMLYIDTGDKKFGSSVLQRLVGREKIKRSLQQFVDGVVDILIHFACTEGTPWCSGQVQSHQVVRQFLLPRASDS